MITGFYMTARAYIAKFLSIVWFCKTMLAWNTYQYGPRKHPGYLNIVLTLDSFDAVTTAEDIESQGLLSLNQGLNDALKCSVLVNSQQWTCFNLQLVPWVGLPAAEFDLKQEEKTRDRLAYIDNYWSFIYFYILAYTNWQLFCLLGHYVNGDHFDCCDLTFA